ncbi:ankyrin repeat domain-containing protein [Pseudoalteromonas sp. SSMSWG5]|uniref:ankyrin repeat domain-containing protein n=1 Tax=Pseudoalteromonas sp. SSMSWG5 TaxID=3139396 RepID=UPI003BAA4523
MDESTANLLIFAGADVNAVSPRGWTPLMWQVRQANTDVVKLLLKKGAKLDSKDNEGNSILHVAADISIYSDDSFENGTRRTKIIKTLLEHGADVNTKNNLGETPLMRMAYWAKIDGIRLLLKHGADATVVDNSGSTALHHLAKNIDVMPEDIFYNSYPGEDEGGNQFIVYFKAVANEMIQKGADLNIKNNNGETATDVASNHKSDMAEALKAVAKG